jgi:beta-glucosidase
MKHYLLAASIVIGSGVALAQPDKAPGAKQPEKPAATAPAAASAAKKHSAIEPVSKENEAWWKARHESFNARAKQGAANGDIDLIFLGDSITQGWETDGKDVWAKSYGPRHAFNIGVSGDRTQHVLWRLDHGNVDGLAKPAKGHAPKLLVMMIGTNNSNGNDNSAEEIGDGVKAIVASLRQKLPETKILMLAIFPRGEKPNPQREKNAKASELASKAADGKMVHYLDIGKAFLEKDGTLTKEVMPDALHLSPKGYQIWADSIEPKVRELMGEPSPGGGAVDENK